MAPTVERPALSKERKFSDDYKPSLYYWGVQFNKFQMVQTHGGTLVENMIQALCRDVLAAGMVRLERSGIPTVLHVHDEVVCETTDLQAGQAETILEQVPSWAEGMPIRVKGFRAARFRKD